MILLLFSSCFYMYVWYWYEHTTYECTWSICEYIVYVIRLTAILFDKKNNLTIINVEVVRFFIILGDIVMIESILGLVVEKTYAVEIICKQECYSQWWECIDGQCQKDGIIFVPTPVSTANTTKSSEQCNGTQKDVNACSCLVWEKQAKDSNDTYVCLKQWSNMGIDCPAEKMVNGTCSMSVYTMLGIRQSTPNPSAGIFINDVVLSATFFIGTIVTLAIIYAWRELIRSSSTGDSGDYSKAQGKIINALIWLALVSLSYTIIRLIQYLAAG